MAADHAAALVIRTGAAGIEIRSGLDRHTRLHEPLANTCAALPAVHPGLRLRHHAAFKQRLPLLECLPRRRFSQHFLRPPAHCRGSVSESRLKARMRAILLQPQTSGRRLNRISPSPPSPVPLASAQRIHWIKPCRRGGLTPSGDGAGTTIFCWIIANLSYLSDAPRCPADTKVL